METLKILWVEDDAQKLKGLVKPLEKDGHKIIFAEDKKEALELIENDDFNLIIVDLIIPTGEQGNTGNDHFVGVDLINDLKQKNIVSPIIVLSVVRDYEIIKELERIGVKAILPKGSFLPSHLKNEVYRILGKEIND